MIPTTFFVNTNIFYSDLLDYFGSWRDAQWILKPSNMKDAFCTIVVDNVCDLFLQVQKLKKNNSEFFIQKYVTHEAKNICFRAHVVIDSCSGIYLYQNVFELHKEKNHKKKDISSNSRGLQDIGINLKDYLGKENFELIVEEAYKKIHFILSVLQLELQLCFASQPFDFFSFISFDFVLDSIGSIFLIDIDFEKIFFTCDACNLCDSFYISFVAEFVGHFFPEVGCDKTENFKYLWF